MGLFAFYLIYTRQFKWFFGVARNMLLGVPAILGLNLALAPAFNVAVGVNALTAFIVGVLGLPGLVLLFAARFMI